MTAEECETIIRWDRASDEMHIYTCDSTVWNRLDKSPDVYKFIKADTEDGKVVSKNYLSHKKMCTLRSKKVERVTTDEQREVSRERMRSLRQAQLAR